MLLQTVVKMNAVPLDLPLQTIVSDKLVTQASAQREQTPAIPSLNTKTLLTLPHSLEVSHINIKSIAMISTKLTMKQIAPFHSNRVMIQEVSN